MSTHDHNEHPAPAPTTTGGLSRRGFLKTSAAVGGLSMLQSSPSAMAFDQLRPSTGKKKPNIVFIISDQLNIDAIAHFSSHFKDPAYGGHWVHTPNLDRLAREGTAFMQSNSADPVCSPSRSCLFTGRMATETGVVANNIGIAKDVPNMGQWFERHSDYRRIYCGKWHAGGKWNYPDVSGPRKIPGFDIIPVGGSGTGIYADPQVSNSVASFISNDHGSQPYLVVASLMNPHDICYWTWALNGASSTPPTDVYGLKDKLPILPPNFNYHFKEPCGEKPYHLFQSDTQWRNYTYDYYRMVEDIDEHVGRIMDAVRERDEDTVVVFTSDHGEGLARHKRVQKWHPYQSSLTVPFIVWSPNRVNAGVLDTAHLVSGVDIMPTFCDFAGITPPPHQRGYSLRPLVDKDAHGADAWRDHIYAEYKVTGRIIRTKKYKYAMRYEYSGNVDKPYVRKSDGQHTQFVPGQGDQYAQCPNALLFDLENDPWELKNLIDDPQRADVVTQHKQLLAEWEANLIPGHHYDRN